MGNSNYYVYDSPHWVSENNILTYISFYIPYETKQTEILRYE